MKTKFLSILMITAFVGSMSADCIVKTPCQQKSYQEEGLTVSRSTDGTGPITVKSSSGTVIDVIECSEQGLPSVECSVSVGTNPDTLCDRIPATASRLRKRLGCD